MNTFTYERVYTSQQETKIQSEFNRVEGKCYLDHAGATLYSEKQIANVLSDFNSNLYGNPHSRNISSKFTEDSIYQIRYNILDHFNTNSDEYDVIFTSGATAALKLVSESFDYRNGCFIHLQDNHTSVLGMRFYAPNVKVLPHNEAFNILNHDFLNNDIIEEENDKNSLFVYPAQCNYSGTKYPLEWIENVQNGALNYLCKSKQWYCLLDCASYVSTNALDLSKCKPDFLCVSFYKIFGYPTGLGALLVKKSAENILVKKYYGGGTIYMGLSIHNVAIPRKKLHERFEDGTIPYLSILSLKHGFETLKRLNLTMDLISKHTYTLAQYVYNKLLMLHHSNGKPAAILYHDTTFENRNHQGAIVNFNLLRSNGEYIGYVEVLHISNLFGIQLRTGCFCNLGSCQRHLKLSADDVIKQFDSGHVCGDEKDLIDGKPTGSVRISFGYMSRKQDADEFVSMIEECFVEEKSVKKIPENYDNLRKLYHEKFSVTSSIPKVQNLNLYRSRPHLKGDAQGKVIDKLKPVTNKMSTVIRGELKNMFIYPVKSCGAFKIEGNWGLVPAGLKYDREWMIVNNAGVCLTQKTNSNLCKIKPCIDLKNNKLELNYEDFPKISIPLNIDDVAQLKIYPCQSKVCGDPIIGWDCGQNVSDWLHNVLGCVGLRLLKQASDGVSIRKKTVKGESITLSLANQAQFLLINKPSVEWLRNFLTKENSLLNLEDLIYRFRPNFVVDFQESFVENDLKELEINNLIFKANGRCTRCQMICIDQHTGAKSSELLTILSRELKGKITFGVYLKRENSDVYGEIGVTSAVSAKVNAVESD